MDGKRPCGSDHRLLILQSPRFRKVPGPPRGDPPTGLTLLLASVPWGAACSTREGCANQRPGKATPRAMGTHGLIRPAPWLSRGALSATEPVPHAKHEGGRGDRGRRPDSRARTPRSVPCMQGRSGSARPATGRAVPGGRQGRGRKNDPLVRVMGVRYADPAAVSTTARVTAPPSHGTSLRLEVRARSGNRCSAPSPAR